VEGDAKRKKAEWESRVRSKIDNWKKEHPEWEQQKSTWEKRWYQEMDAWKKQNQQRWGTTSEYDEKIQRDFENNFLEKFLGEWDSELDKANSRRRK